MIVGAGFSGLLAAHVFQKMPVVEAGPPGQTHKALLRFRTEEVSRLTGVPFKKVKVRKGIYHAGKFCMPNISLANKYSKKCLGKIEGDRSIWNLETVERYIAPENFYEQLIDAVGNRITWNQPCNFLYHEKLINTAPMNIVLGALKIDTNIIFERSKIFVKTYRVPDCDVYQTVYFPTSIHAVYRASITGDLLIVEMANDYLGWETEVSDAFGIDIKKCTPLGAVSQKYGKISDVNDIERKNLIYRLSNECDIYSVGRFAVWKNILLDDVVQDLNVIKKMIHSSEYDKRKFLK